MSRANPKTEPLILAAKKAYKSSEVGKLDALFSEQRKWKRRRTIANAHLEDVRQRIEDMAFELAQEKVKP